MRIEKFTVQIQATPYLPLINDLLSATWWQRTTLRQLDDACDALAPLMKYRKQAPSEPLELDLQDLIDSRKWVIVRKEGLKMMVDEYRKKVEEKIEQLAHRHPTIQRLRRGDDVAVDDLMGAGALSEL